MSAGAHPAGNAANHADLAGVGGHGQAGHGAGHGAAGHAAGHDPAWQPPAWLARLSGRLARSLPAARGERHGLAQALERAEAAGAVLVLRPNALQVLAATLGPKARIVVADEPHLDTLAEFTAGLGLALARWSPYGTAASRALEDLFYDVDRPVLLATEPPGHEAFLLAALDAIGRPALALQVRGADGAAWPDWSARPAALRRKPVVIASAILAPARTADQRAALAEALSNHLCAPALGPALVPPPTRRVQATAAYRAASAALSGATRPYLLARARRGKEARTRLAERRGIASAPRPEGRLIWAHAASVGETMAVLPVTSALITRGLCDCVLVTTGTVTSAELIAARAPGRIVHQFVPLDVPRYVERFLDHWRPSAAIFVESELWPNLMRGAAARGIPVTIVNGRMSARSLARWRRLPDLARATLSATRLVLAQSPAYGARFAELGAPDVRSVGNLKFDSPSPEGNSTAEHDLAAAIAGRPVWVAASTHAGEEALIVEAHLAIREHFPNLLTLLVPRHPARAEAVAKIVEERWLVATRRSTGSQVGAKTDIYIADTIGEMGIFYRLAPVAFVGGSLVETGGHNPIEPALLGSAILHGPLVHNFADTYEALDDAGAAIKVANSGELARQVTDLLAEPERRAALTAAARAEIARNAGALERSIAALTPLLKD